MTKASPPPSRVVNHWVPARLRVIEGRFRGACVAGLGQDLASRYQSDPETAWSAIVAMDPTRNKRYLQWCARLVAGGALKAEDFYKAPGLLTELQRCRPMMRRDGVSTDIGQYDSLPALAKALAPYREQITEGEGHRRDQARAEAESIIHHRCDDLLVVEPKTEFASCIWGRGTQWCTAATEADNAFEKYTSNGNRLIIYLFRDGAKYQGSTNGAFADAQDYLIGFGGLPPQKRDLALGTQVLRELAVQLNGMALKYIPADQQTERVRGLAIQQNGMALECIPADQQSERVREMAVQQNGWALRCIPAYLQTERVRELAAQQSGMALKFIPADRQTERVTELAVQESGWALGCISVDQQTERTRALAVQQNGMVLSLIPADQQTEKVRELAVAQNGAALQYIPSPQQTDRLKTIAAGLPVTPPLGSLNKVETPRQVVFDSWQPRVGGR